MIINFLEYILPYTAKKFIPNGVKFIPNFKEFIPNLRVVDLKLNISVFLKLLFEAKKQGKGRIGRGKMYTRLIEIITGNDSLVLSSMFGGNIDRFLLRLIRNETEYPYTLFDLEEFSNSADNFNKAKKYLLNMKHFCEAVLDDDKIDMLIYNFLEIIKSDSSIKALIYGDKFIDKSALFGSFIHPKQICIEALLLALLYHVHKYPSIENADSISLTDIPKQIYFKAVHFEDKNSLETDVAIDLSEFIRDNSERHIQTASDYDIKMSFNDEIITKLPSKDNLFIYGAGGIGKTTLLRSIIGKEERIYLYFDLKHTCSGLLLQILLKYRYLGEYKNYSEYCIFEGENTAIQELHELEKLFKSIPLNGEPEYVLLLDSLIDTADDMISEITAAVKEWNNVRIIISGRKVPKDHIFDSFDKVEVLGISDIELGKYGDMYDSLKTLLKLPPLLNAYKSGEYTTVGELLDCYFMQYEKSRYSDNSAVSFIIEIVLPFVAKRITEYSAYSLKRSDVSEIIDTVTGIFFDNNSVYLNYIVPKGYKKESLPNGRDELIKIILDTGIIISDEDGILSFEANIYRDYFAAKYVLNIIEMLDKSFGKDDIDGKSKLFYALDFGSVWFNDDSIYRLVGEIAGDYRNTPDSAHYYKTPLDTLLEMCREFECSRATENIIRTMSSVRNNEICDVDFSDTMLPLSIPSYIKFSDKDGELPCDFRNCKVTYIGLLEPLKFSVRSDNNRYILAAFENAYFVLWDTENEQIIWDKELSKNTYISDEFACAEFIDNDKYILISDIKGSLKIETSSGDLCGQYNHKEYRSQSYEEYLDSNCVPQNAVDEELRSKILQQLPHFKNCDFRDAEFAFEAYRETLNSMGEIVD